MFRFRSIPACNAVANCRTRRADIHRSAPASTVNPGTSRIPLEKTIGDRETLNHRLGGLPVNQIEASMDRRRRPLDIDRRYDRTSGRLERDQLPKQADVAVLLSPSTRTAPPLPSKTNSSCSDSEVFPRATQLRIVGLAARIYTAAPPPPPLIPEPPVSPWRKPLVIVKPSITVSVVSP